MAWAASAKANRVSGAECHAGVEDHRVGGGQLGGEIARREHDDARVGVGVRRVGEDEDASWRVELGVKVREAVGEGAGRRHGDDDVDGGQVGGGDRGGDDDVVGRRKGVEACDPGGVGVLVDDVAVERQDGGERGDAGFAAEKAEAERGADALAGLLITGDGGQAEQGDPPFPGGKPHVGVVGDAERGQVVRRRRFGREGGLEAVAAREPGEVLTVDEVLIGSEKLALSVG